MNIAELKKTALFSCSGDCIGRPARGGIFVTNMLRVNPASGLPICEDCWGNEIVAEANAPWSDLPPFEPFAEIEKAVKAASHAITAVPQFIELAQRIDDCRRSKTQLSLKEYCKVLDELVALGQSFEEGKT